MQVFYSDVQLRHAQRQIGHVECARGAVNDGQADEEKSRGHQVQHHILQAHFEALPPQAMHHQHIRGNQQHFKKHKQVK